MLISCQPNGVNLLYFKLRSLELTQFIVCNGSTTLGSKDIENKKTEFVARLNSFPKWSDLFAKVSFRKLI